MSVLKELTYLIFESTRLEQWEAFGSQVLGADVARRADGSVRMRIDDHAYRFAVQPGDREDLFAAGFTVPDDRVLATLEADLRARGLDVQRGTAAELADSGVAGLI